jgi:hypothetical protein
VSAVTVLQITGLCKLFKDHRALEGSYLSVSEGETVFILGSCPFRKFLCYALIGGLHHQYVLI